MHPFGLDRLNKLVEIELFGFAAWIVWLYPCGLDRLDMSVHIG